MKSNNFTLEQIQKNLKIFYKKLVNKNMNLNFWVISSRCDFKPIKKIIIKDKKENISNIHSIKEIRDHILFDKGEYYKDKKFADIKICLDENVLEIINDIKEYKNLQNKIILTIFITIYLIDSNGDLNLQDKSELKVNYVIDDFKKLNFKIKNIEVLMRLLNDSVINTNSNNGISYQSLLNKLKKNKI